MQIYEFITQRGKLTEEHRQELKAKRGFSEETIKNCRLFSGGEYLLDYEAELLKNFDQDALKESGVCVDDGKNITISPSLLDGRVIIPYLDQDNVAYFLRPHKLGLKGVPVEFYQKKNLGKNLIITEGEFKAMAAQQLGFNCIAVPGISSFADNHFMRFVKELNDAKVRDVLILFDNEIKDDPKFKNYKDTPAKRWDTQYYAYYMARELDRQGFYTRIATLPDAWRRDGKIDIDGALAQGRTKDDFDNIILSSVIAKHFFEDLPQEAQLIVKRKLKRKYFKSRVTKEFGKYIAHRKIGKNEFEIPISNFTIKIIATHETQEGIIREVQFTNEFGEVTPAFSLDPDGMSGSDGFKTFCLSKGNYIWRGNREDLADLWEQEFLEDDGRHIIEPDHIGWIPSEKMWLFGNTAITKDGREMRPDKSHIFWTEKKGLKPVPLGVTSGKTAISEGLPYLNLGSFDTGNFCEKLRDSVGVNEANLMLGWSSAVLYMEEVFNLYGCFPFLFVTGRRGSGKSTIAEWLMNMFGLENMGKIASDTTPVGLQRYLGYYSNLPVFVDEYRNTKNITYKNGFLRNAYNRQSAGKGIKANFGVREAKVRGTLLIGGEETPEDNALLTRCIIILIKESNRTNNHFNWFQANKTRFSRFTLDILRQKPQKLDKFISILHEGKDWFVSQGADDRTAINYAVAAAGYTVAFNESVDFADWLTHEVQRAKAEYQDEQAVSMFLEDLMVLKTKKQINEDYWRIRDGKIYLYFHGLYSAWAEHYRKTRGVEAFKSSSIRDYLKEESGFIEINVVQRINKQLKKCVVFDLESAPDELKNLIEGSIDTGNDVEF